MPRKTIKELERLLDLSRQEKEASRGLYAHAEQRVRDLVKINEDLRKDVDLARRDAQWHKQLAQNLSEAICAHMRNR